MVVLRSTFLFVKEIEPMCQHIENQAFVWNFNLQIALSPFLSDVDDDGGVSLFCFCLFSLLSMCGAVMLDRDDPVLGAI